MKLPLDPPRAPRRTSLLARVLHLGHRADARHPLDARSAARSVEPSDAVSSERPDSVPAEPDRPRETGDIPRADSEADVPSLESELYREARELIKQRAWGHAQRALEAAARQDPDCPAVFDLASVRTIRRSLRRIARWPSDVDAHLDLGRACFDLDLGDDALAQFLLAQRLAPLRYEGFTLAALEYLYRGEYTRAMSTWLRARELNPELPDLDEVMGSLPVT